MRYFLCSFLILCAFYSCRKQTIVPAKFNPVNNTNLFVGQYFPLNFGNKWFYKKYTLNKGVKTYYGTLTYEYDSLPGVIHIYNSSHNLQSWMYVNRYNNNQITSGSGQLLVTDNYIDSPMNKSYIMDPKNSASKRIQGGLHQLQTRFGNVNSIITSNMTSTFCWIRHFGHHYGIVREEEYTLQGSDTIDHYLIELDSFHRVQ